MLRPFRVLLALLLVAFAAAVTIPGAAQNGISTPSARGHDFRMASSSEALQSTERPNPGCALAGSDITRESQTSGVLRADPVANDTTNEKIASDLERDCALFTEPSALQRVRLRIADNNIIVSGDVATERDEHLLLRIVQANADGRTVFNRLQVTSSKREESR